MHLLQTIIPIPMPIDTGGGPSGPWTEGDTKILITINLTLIILWVILVTLNWLANRKSYPKDTIFTYMVPIKSWGEWFTTFLISMFLYIILGVELIFGIGYAIYHLIF